jgi:hypothetical protein
MTQRNVIDGWETKISNSEVTLHGIWPLAKSLMNKDKPKAPTAIHGPSGLKFLPLKKANTIADCQSRDSSVGTALGYGLNDRGSRVRFPARAGNFSLHYRVQNGSGAHPASYPVGTRVSFPGGKAAGA